MRSVLAALAFCIVIGGVAIGLGTVARIMGG